MKRVIIVHCWDGTPEYAWYPWIKTELEKKGYTVEVPLMPETNEPKLDLWLPKLKEAIGTPDEDLVLIGHSIGCAAIMRYLETLKDNERVGQVIFVAGFTDDLGFNEITSFFQDPLNYSKMKHAVKNGIVAIQSDDDPYVAMKYAEILKAGLDAKVVIKHGAKHMSGAVDNEESCIELPEILENIV